MEKLKPNLIALSLGVTASIVSVICLILVAVLPLQLMIKGVNAIMHGIDISSIAMKNITFAGSVIGVIEAFLIAAAIGYIFAFIYNWLGEKF